MSKLEEAFRIIFTFGGMILGMMSAGQESPLIGIAMLILGFAIAMCGAPLVMHDWGIQPKRKGFIHWWIGA